MGYIRHDAIAVTSDILELINEAHAKAIEIIGDIVTPIIASPFDGYYSFFIAPDGSKEFWDEDVEYGFRRRSFICYLHSKKYSDGSSSIKYAEFYYGDDDGKSEIVSHN